MDSSRTQDHHLTSNNGTGLPADSSPGGKVFRSRLRKAVIVGAGPVGCLAAISLSKLGWQVDVYEGRNDIRISNGSERQRSINLAISHRGIAALQAIDASVTERFLKTIIPVYGRMIHYANGMLGSQSYDLHGQAINSVDRALFNVQLLNEAHLLPNIHFYFEHKVQSVDFDDRSMNVRDNNAGKDLKINFDFCIGTDGSHSVIRGQMMRVTRMDYQQMYIPHEYMELRMPAAIDGEGRPSYALDPHHLHIWPRHSFMLMGLPNQDKSFTCTLFAPTVDFQKITGREDFVQWMKEQFPDAVPLIGETALLFMWDSNPRSPLITVKATPYHYKDRVIIMGDAAHSQVPFYGQGLNCGLEDVRVLDGLLREQQVDSGTGYLELDKSLDPRLARALSKYTRTRHEDLVAICDLAMNQYTEMRHDVTTWSFLFRKAIDNVLYGLTAGKPVSVACLGPLLSRDPFPARNPGGWLPLYTMVTFRPDVSYATAKRKAERQARIISGVVGIGGALSLAISTGLVLHRWRRS